MKKHLLAVLLFIPLLYACPGEKNKEELEEIDGLRAKLTQTDSLLGKVDREEAERLGTEVRNNSQFVQFNLNKVGDTLDFKTALFLTNYQALLRGFETVDEMHKKIAQAVDSVSQNLNNLEHDLQNNSLAPGLTPEGSIEQEEEQVNELYGKAGELRSMLAGTRASYDTLAPKMTAYMSELSLKAAQKQASPK